MRYLFILFALVFTLGVSAQKGSPKTMVDASGNTNDTLTNAGTASLFVGSTFSGKNLLSIQVVADNSTGTTAGTAFLQHSVNATNYVTISTADTLVLTDGASIVWTVTDSPARKYKVLFTGSGTQSTLLTGTYVYK